MSVATDTALVRELQRSVTRLEIKLSEEKEMTDDMRANNKSQEKSAKASARKITALEATIRSHALDLVTKEMELNRKAQLEQKTLVSDELNDITVLA